MGVGAGHLLKPIERNKIMITVEEALKNVDIIVANTNLNRDQHNALLESIKLIVERCKIADEFDIVNKAKKKAEK